MKETLTELLSILSYASLVKFATSRQHQPFSSEPPK
jgi:hypothetical protein